MADFCKACSREHFGEDFGDLWGSPLKLSGMTAERAERYARAAGQYRLIQKETVYQFVV